jgi:hypothetical protein
MRQLIEVYALRARDFSDAVARLGQHRDIGPGLLGLVKEVSRRRALCFAAGDELDKYIHQAGHSSAGKAIC